MSNELPVLIEDDLQQLEAAWALANQLFADEFLQLELLAMPCSPTVH